jgi:hypothetical protein
MDWIDETLDIIRTSTIPQDGWQQMLRVFHTTLPSGSWNQLPPVNMAQDIMDAQAWLTERFADTSAPQATGIYLGLDTLNMDDPDGYNIELGATDACDASTLESDWVWNCPWYGEQHLIKGLRQLKASYDQPQWNDLANEADYIIPLGYSGLILATAFEQMPYSRSVLVVWGFHDGDLFFLGRRTATTFEKICQVI